jgi:CubicO group peptidase (beta-lactamase class C family)
MPDQITNAATVNRPDVRRASIPGAGGIMNARSLARHYAMLANGGELDGVRLLSPERIDLIRACAIDAEDIVLNTRTRRGLGYTLGGGPAIFGNEIMGWSGKEFGHGGLGGSIGYADPEHRFAFGLTKTLLKRDEARTDSAAFKLAELLRSQLY